MNMELIIHTKKMPNGMWSCYTTHNGSDRAFTGYDISVVAEMSKWLKNKGVTPKWDEPIIYPPKQPIEARYYRKIKLDNF